jgi:alpha-D-xyloside xylohydrolase
MRPLWLEYPKDEMTNGIDTNYMFGDAFLIAATYPQLDEAKVYLPPDSDWFNFFNSKLIPKG